VITGTSPRFSTVPVDGLPPRERLYHGALVSADESPPPERVRPET
jgi:hypothetical protein